VLAPTRELVQQIAQETKLYAVQHGVGVAAIYGGGASYEQVKALKAAPEIVIATPGRLIDLIHDKATNLQRCTFLVLDEADRMLDMGFSLQVNSIVDHVRGFGGIGEQTTTLLPP